MNNKKILKLLEAGENLYDQIATKHGCGWMDGGCFTFAKAVNEIFPDETSLFHISRKRSVPDHAVVYFSSLDIYLDADGPYKIKDLFRKMKEVEGVDVTLCTMLYNIDDQIIYDDIKELLKKEFFKLMQE